MAVQKVVNSGNVTSIYYKMSRSFEHYQLYMSDIHFDSIACNRELLRHHLKDAKERNADIFIFGDLFDAMQGRFDPRRNMDELRPEFRREDYFDYVVLETGEFLSPFANHIRLLCNGNHETKVRKHANTDLMNRLSYELNTRHGAKTYVGGYGGWIRLMFDMGQGQNSGPRFSVKVKYYHGTGGDAPVTRGVIWTNRQAVYLPDADIVVNGHNHHEYYVPIARERIATDGRLYGDIQHHIRIPGYKEEYGDGSRGWLVERGGVPKPLGSWWIRFRYVHDRLEIIPEPAHRAPSLQIPGSNGGNESDREEYLEDNERF